MMKKLILKLTPGWALKMYHSALVGLAARRYRYPSREMVVIGVTGTNGKTTTVNLISRILEAGGLKTGFATTANFKIGGRVFVNRTKKTMQGRFRLQKMLRQMKDAGAQVAIVETSSQGILQGRHHHVEYDILVFTNLTPEHIEAHGSFEAYRRAKEVVFAELAGKRRKRLAGVGEVPKTIIVNGADREAGHFLRYKAERRVIFWAEDAGDAERAERVFGLSEKYGADEVWMARDVELRAGGGAKFELCDLEGGATEIETGLSGLFNVENAAAAIAAAKVLRVGDSAVARALRDVTHVAGRLERVDEGQEFSVFVDYAHEPRGLENVLKVLGGEVGDGGRLIVVTGSQGGGRDKAKRAVIGRTAGAHADVVVVTNEDPYDEEPAEIIEAVAAGAIEAGKREGEDLYRVAERRDGIAKAIGLAREDEAAGKRDVVLLAGKGAEKFIVSKGGRKIPHDDREVAREILGKAN